MFAVTRKTLVLVIILAGLCLSVGCYSGYKIGYDEGLRAVKMLRVGYLVAYIHQIACFVARDQGPYEKEVGFGYGFKYFEYISGPAQMMHFVAGELDIGYVGCVPALTALSKGADLKIVASANLEGSAIVAKPEIANVEGLNGKLVGTPGIGTIQDSLLSAVEENKGISVTHRHYKVSDLPLALEKGEIDAFIAWEPFCAEVVVAGIGHVVYTSHEILPQHQCCVFYISGQISREDRDLAVRLVRAHVKAMEFAIENENGAMEIFAARTGKSLDVVRESWKRMVWNYTPSIESMKIFTQWLINAGKIEAGDVPDINAFVENAVDLTLLADALK